MLGLHRHLPCRAAVATVAGKAADDFDQLSHDTTHAVTAALQLWQFFSAHVEDSGYGCSHHCHC
jgi:hypothetical protein